MARMYLTVRRRREDEMVILDYKMGAFCNREIGQSRYSR